MSIQALLPAYEKYHAELDPLTNIQSDMDYAVAIVALEELMEKAGDTEEDRYGDLIDAIGKAINRYEENEEQSTMEFVKESRELPTDIALLVTLIDQHDLTYDDLPEIGKKSMVSQVISQDKNFLVMPLRV